MSIWVFGVCAHILLLFAQVRFLCRFFICVTLRDSSAWLSSAQRACFERSKVATGCVTVYSPCSIWALRSSRISILLYFLMSAGVKVTHWITCQSCGFWWFSSQLQLPMVAMCGGLWSLFSACHCIGNISLLEPRTLGYLLSWSIFARICVAQCCSVLC